MRIVYSVRTMNAVYEDMEIALPIIESVKVQTQHSSAEQPGLDLKLTCSYLKHCIRKGLAKIEQVLANRYLYYLTIINNFDEKHKLGVCLTSLVKKL